MALKPLAALVVRYPLSFVIAGLVGSALSLLLAMTSLEFQFGRGDLISSSDRYQQLAEIPEPEFQETLDTAAANGRVTAMAVHYSSSTRDSSMALPPTSAQQP